MSCSRGWIGGSSRPSLRWENEPSGNSTDVPPSKSSKFNYFGVWSVGDTVFLVNDSPSGELDELQIEGEDGNATMLGLEYWFSRRGETGDAGLEESGEMGAEDKGETGNTRDAVPK